MGVNDPRGMANLDPRGMVGKIYVGDHQTLHHIESVSPWPHGFREDFLRLFSYIVLHKHILLPPPPPPPGVWLLDPRGLIGRT